MKLLPYACSSAFSMGRLHHEQTSENVCPFQQDRNRVHYSTAFRRLEYKTQVFINYIGDHYRTRLTHSLEVSQIARDVCRQLGLNEDLAEAIALSHDIGHPPFGHAGEDGLNIAMKKFGGFNHNAQTIKVLTVLEHRYIGFRGVNLTWGTIEGVAKHNGPLLSSQKGQDQIQVLLQGYVEKFSGRMDTYPSLEAQVASIADDIAYCCHDIDDGLRAGFFTLETLEELPAIWAIITGIMEQYSQISQTQLINEAIRRIAKFMSDDLLCESNRRIANSKIKDYQDVQEQTIALIGFSKHMEATKNALKKFLMHRVYRHHKINQISYKSRLVVQKLFEVLYANPDCLPGEWVGKIISDSHKAEVIKDYIAGMTDRYALKLHASFNGNSDF
ncbi:MAG: deoxyguanosinetriphosphate triphosphohydrolase [Proteobacteria bacterium]|nr:deoxyguanosinetriphosphate triphosphohydrolase [Pseudomonadota bacterium]